MNERQKYTDKILELLTFVKAKVEVSNSINLMDINIHSENFYRDFLNLLYKFKLKNINIIEKNAVAIDLGDEEEKIAIQVTSTSDLVKTKKTVQAFIKNKLYEKYDRLKMLNIINKKKHRTDFIGDVSIYQLDPRKDIWDINSIFKDICDLDLDRIKEIHEFLKNEIKLNTDEVLANEIKTFISLISYLSDESQSLAGTGFIEEPDPDRKIDKRFAEHSNYLKKEYQNLYMEYGEVLKGVMTHADFGHVRVRRLGLHLQNVSDEALNQCNGDSAKALEILVEKYKTLLSNNNIRYDEIAIKFFLVDQLIRCNVFPNKEENYG